MLFNKHNTRFSKPMLAGYFARVVVLGVPAFILLSFLCRPAFGGVSISPEVVAVSGDQTVRVTAHLDTRLPVVVDLVELLNPLQNTRLPNQSQMWGGHTVARLARQTDGSFVATLDLHQRSPGTRYFQLAARYAFLLPFPQMNGTDLRSAVIRRPVSLPPDPGEAGKATLEGIDSDHDGVRDDLQREIFFAYPDSEKIRRALEDVYRLDGAWLMNSTNPEALNYLQGSAIKRSLCTIQMGLTYSPKNTKFSVIINTIRLNTYLRHQVAEQIVRNEGSSKYTSEETGLSNCLFDPNSMQD